MNITNLLIIKTEAQKYLLENPERFTELEKKKFLSNLNNWLTQKDYVYDDEVYDFLIEKSFINKPTRAISFFRYINSKYNPTQYKNILDVGAGRMCHLSSRLGRAGYTTTAIDPKIRLTNNEASQLKIHSTIKDNFYCDEYTPSTKSSFDIQIYDLLVGLEPCDATEHIIRQSLKYNKPFEVILCYTVHKTLNNTKCKNIESWYNYLKSISNEVKINNVDNSFIATNN